MRERAREKRERETKEKHNLTEIMAQRKHTLVESTLFPRHFNEMLLNQRGIDVELKSVHYKGNRV